ncbi:ATP-binding protein [Nigerium massiliense]|uniref:AAA family ATPase n=1 Tax=Nigerium massiliense TaxID=1522317 RepID=UPI00058CE3F5|nr:AAA family ATPase [Nigerium massiliense]
MLLNVFGPPAVGKMTVGRAIAARGRFRLFHNHMTIEPLLETFGFGTPAFNTLNEEFRRRVLEEAAANNVELVFTIVWALDADEDRALAESYAEIFAGDVAFVELRAPLPLRLERNRTDERLLHKASKRDVEWSDSNVRSLEEEHQMTTEHSPGRFADLLARYPSLVLENTGSASDAADSILDWVTGVDQQRRR